MKHIIYLILLLPVITFGQINLKGGSNGTTQSLNLIGTNLTISGSNTIDLSVIQDGVDDADNSVTNEIELPNCPNGHVPLSDGLGNWVCLDTTGFYSGGGGAVVDGVLSAFTVNNSLQTANFTIDGGTDLINQDFSVFTFDTELLDNDASNEFQDLTLSGDLLSLTNSAVDINLNTYLTSKGFLTSYTETDPVYLASDAANVTAAKITNWDTAFGWGDHSLAGYKSNFTENTAFNKDFGTTTGTVLEGNTTTITPSQATLIADGLQWSDTTQVGGVGLATYADLQSVLAGAADGAVTSGSISGTNLVLLQSSPGTSPINVDVSTLSTDLEAASLYEPIITKNTGFNLNLGTSAGQVAEGNHTHIAANITDFDTEVSNNADVTANTAKRTYPLADETKLSGIEASATADQTDAEIKTAYENNANTNAFTDADVTKLGTIETSAKDDQNADEVPVVGLTVDNYTTTLSLGLHAHFEGIDNELGTLQTTNHVAATIASSEDNLATLSGQAFTFITPTWQQTLTKNPNITTPTVVGLTSNNLTFVADNNNQLQVSPTRVLLSSLGATGASLEITNTGGAMWMFGNEGMSLDGDYGTATKVLSSNGDNAAPTWKENDFSNINEVQTLAYADQVITLNNGVGETATIANLASENPLPILFENNVVTANLPTGVTLVGIDSLMFDEDLGNEVNVSGSFTINVAGVALGTEITIEIEPNFLVGFAEEHDVSGIAIVNSTTQSYSQANPKISAHVANSRIKVVFQSHNVSQDYVVQLQAQFIKD